MTTEQTNEVNIKCETAIETVLAPYLVDTIGEGTLYTSDRDVAKDPLPYIVINTADAQEEIGPFSGIYKVPTTISFFSGAIDTSTDDRKEVIASINNCMYTNFATALSAITGFHCHGVVPTGGGLTLDQENFVYVFVLSMDIICMPRDN